MNKNILGILGILILVVLVGVLLFTPKPVLEKEDNLYRFSSEKDVYKTFKEGFDSSYGGPVMMAGEERMAMDASQSAPSSAVATKSYSETNIQVEGVDEADIIKTDGDYIYLLRNKTDNSYIDYRGIYSNNSELVILESDPVSEILSRMVFEKFYANEIFINSNKLVLFGISYVPYEYSVYEDESTEVSIESSDSVVDMGRDELDPNTREPNTRDSQVVRMPYVPTIEMTSIKIIDISNKQAPKLLKSFDFEGNYLTSRKINDYVYFVINSYPKFYELNRYSCKDIAPLYRESTNNPDKELEPVVPCNRIGYISPVQAQSFLTIVGLSLNDLSLDKEVIVGSGQNVYASLDNLYIVQTTWPRYTRTGEILENYVQESVITKFSLDQGKINYQTTGRVEGYVLNQFSMDEHNGYFRIATTSQEFFGWDARPMPVIEPLIVDVEDVNGDRSDDEITPDEEIIPEEPIIIIDPIEPIRPLTNNHLFVLNQDLEVVGSVNDIASGERIFSARFMGDKAYMITFVQVDPLFVIDLKNPTNPKILGELKIPGFSNYLHPYSENYLIGIGKEVLENEDPNDTFVFEQGVKLSIFDVTDLENPIELYKEVIGDRGTYSDATNNHKAFMFDKEKNLLIIPINLAQYKQPPENRWMYGEYTFQGMYVYNIDIENGFSLRGRVTHYDSDVERTKEFEMYNFFGGHSIKRSLYIDNVLYTFSNNRLQLNNLTSLDLIKKINLE
jgi:inhibitor of cysteine peptidase